MPTQRKIPVTTRLPLTREQEGLWVEWKLSPTGSSYNTCIQMSLEGAVDEARFCRALATIVADHDLLHGSLTETDGKPRFALTDRPYELDLIDVSDGAPVETDTSRARAYVELNRRRDASIDLTQFPLVRAALIRAARARWYFIGVVPHIISDGYSALSIMRAIANAYIADDQSPASAAGKPDKDWTDYLREHGTPDPASTAAARAFWAEALDDADHYCPIAPPPTGIADTAGKRHYFGLDAAIAKRLSQLARAQRTSIFSALAALYGGFLHRETDQRDLVIAHSVDLRPRGYRDAFGFFVNVIPLRMQLDGAQSFNELIRHVGDFRRQSKKHQHLPALDIVGAKRQREPAFDGRLTNVSMGQTVSRFQGLEIPGIRSAALDNDLIEVRDDLSFMYELGESTLGIWLEYRQSAFSEAAIAALAARFQRFILAVTEAPDEALGDCALLTDDEQRQLLRWGDGGPAPAAADTFARWFRARAEQTPGNDALCLPQTGASECWSYETLARAACQQAAALPAGNAPVALVLPRDTSQITAMLACLLSGHPYVPIDPETPALRIETILADCQPCAVLAPATLYPKLALPAGTTRLIPGAALPDASAPPAWPAPPAADTTAYLIYTSGSTGTPKGVAVSHSAMMLRLSWLAETFAVGPGDRVLANTSYAFDVSVAELLWPLGAGATLVLAPPALARDPKRLARLVGNTGVSVMLLVPSALGALLANGEPCQLAGVRHWLAAGEALPEALVAQFQQTLGSTSAAGRAPTLYNLYGPTEATIYATWSKPQPGQPVTIGQPIGGCQAHVLSDRLQLQGIGVEGELCLAGPGLAAGYHNDPARTAERFPDNPFARGKLYRTGDRARWRPDGTLEYLGRADGQIKLRGFRIELGEIQQQLLSHPRVADAAVQAVPGTADSARLAAYFVAKPAAASIADEELVAALRSHLQARLPGYMVPPTLTALPQIPRLPSGKLDRRALPAARAQRPASFAPPQTGPEQAFAAAIAQVLNLPPAEVGLDSNFFELGGDSLLLIGLETELARAELFIDVQDLFANPTIRSALPLAGKQRHKDIDQQPQSGTFPALARHRKLFQDGFEQPAHWNRCILVRFTRHLDPAALERAMAAVLRHHDGLRLTFDMAAQPPSFTLHPVDAVAAPMTAVSLAGLAPADAEARMTTVLNALNSSFSLDQAPLIKLALFDSQEQSTIAIVSHHLLIDMRSCQILMEDLLTAYQAAASGRIARLPDKTTGLGAWSEQLHALIDQDWQAEELPFWQQQLADCTLPIGGDVLRDGPPLTATEHGTEADQRLLTHTLTESQTRVLTRSVSQALEAGVHQLLLGTFAGAYKAWSGLDALTINTCGIGRDRVFEHASLSRTVGELNTVYPLRIPLGTGSQLQAVQDAMQAVPADGLHYGMLRYIAGHEVLAKAPEPAVFFNYVSRIDSALGRALGANLEEAPEAVRTAAPQNRACYALYVEASIRNDRLQLHLGYSSLRFTAARAASLLDGWRAAVEALADTRTD